MILIASPTFSAVRPPDSAKCRRLRQRRERAPIEGQAVAAGKGSGGIGLGIEQDHVGDVPEAVGLGGVLGRGNGDRLDQVHAEAALDVRQALRRLAAVKLQQVGRGDGQHLLDQRIVGIDQHRHRGDASGGGLGHQGRFGERHVARALLEEHDADIVGAGGNRRLDQIGRPHAANFHLHRHFDAAS